MGSELACPTPHPLTPEVLYSLTLTLDSRGSNPAFSLFFFFILFYFASPFGREPRIEAMDIVTSRPQLCISTLYINSDCDDCDYCYLT